MKKKRAKNRVSTKCVARKPKTGIWGQGLPSLSYPLSSWNKESTSTATYPVARSGRTIGALTRRVEDLQSRRSCSSSEDKEVHLWISIGVGLVNQDEASPEKEDNMGTELGI